MSTRKITNFLAIASAVLLSAAFVTFRPEGTAGSGVYGVATISPTCPVVRTGDSKCAPKPFQATITVFLVPPYTVIPAIYPTPTGSVPTVRKVTSLTTDGEGKFRVSLEPGVYVFRKDGVGQLPSLPDVVASVTGGQFTEVALPFDSGIR